jgi:murein L,D-transpeptidase YafK
LNKYTLITLLCCINLPALAQTSTFVEKQKRYPRVRKAFAEKESVVRSKFAKANAVFPPRSIFIRVFKSEKILELWAKTDRKRMVKIAEYPSCAASGTLGPKRKEGDEQVPEGFYYIDRFNPRSNFHLSLGINYPNRSDKKFADRARPGSNIFIHGDCVSIGCVAITDPYIEELYVTAVLAKTNGQKRIPVHIFPRRLDSDGLGKLKILTSSSPSKWLFWKSLEEPYLYFEKEKKLPKVRINKAGHYKLKR